MQITSLRQNYSLEQAGKPSTGKVELLLNKTQPRGRHKMLLNHFGILGIELGLACNRDSIRRISLKSDESFAFEKTPCISSSCRFLPVRFREYEIDL